MLDLLRETTMADPNSGCWLWTGAIGKDGYGLAIIQGRLRRAHRLAYEASKGVLGRSMACHKCDVRACINPDHLYAGNATTNACDMVSRGRIRSRRGEANANCKLTADAVAEIKSVLRNSPFDENGRRQRGVIKALSSRYRVNRSLIHKIATGEVWQQPNA